MSSPDTKHQNARLTTRQASAQAQRQAMTERRQKFTQRIRKQKKSDWLAQKRGVNNTSAMSDDGAQMTRVDLSQLIPSFLQQTPQTQQTSLQRLYPALQAASMAPTPWTLDDPTRFDQAKQFVQRLGEMIVQQCLQGSAAPENSSSSSSVVVLVLRILVQLTAMHSSSKSCNTEGAYDYYGRRCIGWCDIIGEEAMIVNNFSRLLGLPQPLPDPVPEDLFHVWKETCWLIGNLAQDLPKACPSLRREIPPLSTLLHLAQHVPSSLPVVQAASWAFLNILRGDITASGWDFVNPQQPHSLTVPLICRMLTLEGETAQERDISVQAGWIVAHLSQREDAVVDYLLQVDHQGVNLGQTMLERLYQLGERAQQQQQLQSSQINTQTNYFHHPLLEPCLETFGHWATVSNGKHVPRLLSSTSDRSLLQLVSRLITWGHQGLLQVGDYLQVIWVAGCLLCDAGAREHPSTLLAAPILIPLLTLGLQDHTQQSSKTLSLECKREGILALWNAITAPPCGDQVEESRTALFQQEGLVPLLELILSASSVTDRAQTGGKSGEYMVMMALKNLLLCQDVDTMIAAMHVLNAILHNFPSSRVVFMECDGDEALEEICDLPLGNDRTSQEAADMAANLIDEFFDSSRGVDEDVFADPVLSPAQESGSFVFGLNANAPTVFIPNLDSSERLEDTAMMSTDLHVAPVADDPAAGHGLAQAPGYGRGRGQTLPAWAVQQKQQQQLGR